MPGFGGGHDQAVIVGGVDLSRHLTHRNTAHPQVHRVHRALQGAPRVSVFGNEYKAEDSRRLCCDRAGSPVEHRLSARREHTGRRARGTSAYHPQRRARSSTGVEAPPMPPAPPPPPGPATPAAAETGADRLHTVVVHPQFAQNHLVYVSYPKRGPQGSTLAVARGRLDGAKLSVMFRTCLLPTRGKHPETLQDGCCSGPTARCHVTVGDRDRLCCVGRDDNSLRMRAQDLGNHVGKTLANSRRRQRAGETIRS